MPSPSRSWTSRAVCAARGSGPWWTAENGVPRSRSPRRAAWRRPRSVSSVSSVDALAVPGDVEEAGRVRGGHGALSAGPGDAGMDGVSLRPVPRPAFG